MRFGPRNTLIPGFILVDDRAAALRPHPGRRQLPDRPAAAVPADRRSAIGTSFPAIMTLAMSGATPEDAGLASGLVNTSMQVGGAVGLAVLATLSTERTENLLDSGVSHASALTSGYHLAYLVGAGLAAIAVLIAIFVLRAGPVREPTERRPNRRRLRAPQAEPSRPSRRQLEPQRRAQLNVPSARR